MQLRCLLVAFVFGWKSSILYWTLQNLASSTFLWSKGKQQSLPHTLCTKNVLSAGFHSNLIKRSTAEEEAASFNCSQSEPDRNFLAWVNPELERNFCAIKCPNTSTKANCTKHIHQKRDYYKWLLPSVSHLHWKHWAAHYIIAKKTNYRDNNNKIRLIISAMQLAIEQCGRRPQKEVVWACEIELLTKSTSWLNAMSKVTMTGLEPFGAGRICFSSW